MGETWTTRAGWILFGLGVTGLFALAAGLNVKSYWWFAASGFVAVGLILLLVPTLRRLTTQLPSRKAALVAGVVTDFWRTTAASRSSGANDLQVLYTRVKNVCHHPHGDASIAKDAEIWMEAFSSGDEQQ